MLFFVLRVLSKDAEMERALVDALRPCAYGMSAGTVFSRADRHHFGQFRWIGSDSGTRQLLLASESAVYSWLKGVEKQAQLADTGNALREISADDLRCLQSQTPLLFAGTVGPGDSVYIPPGYIVCERSQGKPGVSLHQRVLVEQHLDVLKPLMVELGVRLPAKSALRAGVLACSSPTLPGKDVPLPAGVAAPAAPTPPLAEKERDGADAGHDVTKDTEEGGDVAE